MGARGELPLVAAIDHASHGQQHAGEQHCSEAGSARRVPHYPGQEGRGGVHRQRQSVAQMLHPGAGPREQPCGAGKYGQRCVWGGEAHAQGQENRHAADGRKGHGGRQRGRHERRGAGRGHHHG